MACFGDYWLEFQELTELAVPSVVTNVLESAFVLSDVAMLGRLGRGNIGALAIGNAMFNLVWYFIEGFFTAQDTLSSIAFEQGDLKALRYWTFASLGSVLILCSFATAIFMFSGLIFEEFFFISPHLRSKSSLHVYILTPSIWFLGCFRVLQKFLLAQNITKPTIRALVIGNICNVILNYVLIFLFGLGFMGVSISTTVTRLVLLFYIFYHTRKLSTFVHMRPELRQLVQGTYAQPILETAEAAEEALFGQSAEQVFIRGQSRFAKAVENVGKQLHIRSLVNWARRWDRVAVPEDDAKEMNSLLPRDKSRSKVKPSRSASKSVKVVPFDDAGAAGGGINNSSNRDSNISAKDDADDGVWMDDHDNATAEASSYLDDIHLSDEAYNEKNGITPRQVTSSAAARTIDQESRNHSVEVRTVDVRVGKSREGHADRDSDGNLAGSEQGSDSDDESSSEDEEDRDARRGPRMLMLIRTLRFFAIGVPGGLMVGLEFWVFCILLIFVSRSGMIPLVTTFIGVTFIETVFLAIPFAISVATTLRVSQLLATQKQVKASICSTVSLTAGFALVGFTAFLTYNLSDLLGHIFTTDEDVIHRVKQIAPYLAGFQTLYGVAGLAQGVLRAQAKQMEIVFFSFSSMYIIGLPLSYWWGYYVRPTHGLYGYWTGMLVGMGLLCTLLLLMVAITDWHHESRAMIVRVNREKEGFSQPTSYNMWMNKGVSGLGGTSVPSNSHDEDHVFSPIATVESIATPMVGIPSIGSKAVGGFQIGAPNLDETLSMNEEIEILAKMEANKESK